MVMGNLYRKNFGNTKIPECSSAYRRRNLLLDKALSRVNEKEPLNEKERKELIRLRKRFPFSKSEEEALRKAHLNRNYGHLGVNF